VQGLSLFLVHYNNQQQFNIDTNYLLDKQPFPLDSQPQRFLFNEQVNIPLQLLHHACDANPKNSCTYTCTSLARQTMPVLKSIHEYRIKDTNIILKLILLIPLPVIIQGGPIKTLPLKVHQFSTILQNQTDCYMSKSNRFWVCELILLSVSLMHI